MTFLTAPQAVREVTTALTAMMTALRGWSWQESHGSLMGRGSGWDLGWTIEEHTAAVVLVLHPQPASPDER